MRTSATHLERIAHRGAPRERLENTLAGFLMALERGADAIELDVHTTSDGVVVVHHDPAVHGLSIASTSWAALAERPLSDGTPIATLAEVLDAVGDRASMYIELKGAGIEAAVIETARSHGHRYALHSFDHRAIARSATLAPDVPRGVLLDRGTANAAAVLSEAVKATRARDVWPHWSLVDATLMTVANNLDARVIVWTVNSLERARALVELGVLGVCTDDVRLLASL